MKQVLISPVLTEKATNLTKEKVYTFVVAGHANKNQVKEALEVMYKVTVDKVRVFNRKGKEKRTGKKMSARKLPDEKIARVTIKDGKIDLFPQA